MNIHLQDFSGHPFQVELARALARRGHHVRHTYCTQYISGRGRLTTDGADSPRLLVQGIAARAPMVKYSPVGRLRFEISYARALQQAILAYPPDVVILCNVPLFASSLLSRFFRNQGLPFLFWHQDVYSLGIADELSRLLPNRLAAIAATGAERIEKRIAERSAAVVVIGEPFLEWYKKWNINLGKVSVIPNWAPVDDIRPEARDNSWSRNTNLPASPLRLLYAGTLGRKHDPRLLIQLLDGCRAAGLDAQLVVISEGIGASMIQEHSVSHPSIIVLPFQPAEDLSAALASGDILLALLETTASCFSIPSKICSYFAAGRPVLVLAPDSNPSASDVTRVGGLVETPDTSGVQRAVQWVTNVSSDPGMIATLGLRSRTFAEDMFDIANITDKFESLLEATLSPKGILPTPRWSHRRQVMVLFRWKT